MILLDEAASPPTQNNDAPAKQTSKVPYRFLFCIILLSVTATLIAPYHHLAMWFGFAIAGYSVIANDSIQTLGTFLSSNQQIKWWVLWLVTGLLLVSALISGWIVNDGDLAFARLTRIPQPDQFNPLVLLAPIALVVLTRYRFPVSTTFLVLSIFSGQLVIQKMLVKSVCGYVIAFMSAFAVWVVIQKWSQVEADQHYAQPLWRLLQFFATGFLWLTWIMHDTANVVVFLPRQMDLPTMLLVVLYLFAVIGYIMYQRGGRMQKVVLEKTNTTDIRIATIIDFCYALVLIVFKQVNNIPMSTTWVFLGILGGRELALAWQNRQQSGAGKSARKLITKDLYRAATGLFVSLLLILFVVRF